MFNIINEIIDTSKISYSMSIKDMSTFEEFNINENCIISSASTIKLLIMAEIMNQADKNILSLSDRIVVNKDVKVPSSILSVLEDGNSYSIRDIVTLMIIQSDNTATNILIDIAGMESINRFARELGLPDTVLQRKMMDFNARSEGRDNFTTSRDMAIFLEQLYNKKVVSKEYSELMLEIMKLQLDRSMLYREIPDEVVIAHKSGELDGINHEVGIIYTDKKDFIFSMLTWDACTMNYGREVVGRTAKLIYDNMR